MRVTKTKSQRPPKPHAKIDAEKRVDKKLEKNAKAPERTPENVEQALVEEVAGTHASAARLKKIVERVLGGGEDAQVQALVSKLTKAARVQTAGLY